MLYVQLTNDAGDGGALLPVNEKALIEAVKSAMVLHEAEEEGADG